MPGAVGLIDSKPLLVTPPSASVGRLLDPGLAAICRAPEIVAKEGLLYIRLETEIEEVSHFVGFGYRVASENSVLENTGEGPVYAGISGITPAALPKVGGYVVKLPPGDCHPVTICWV